MTYDRAIISMYGEQYVLHFWDVVDDFGIVQFFYFPLFGFWFCIVEHSGDQSSSWTLWVLCEHRISQNYEFMMGCWIFSTFFNLTTLCGTFCLPNIPGLYQLIDVDLQEHVRGRFLHCFNFLQFTNHSNTFILCVKHTPDILCVVNQTVQDTDILIRQTRRTKDTWINLVT